MNRRLHRVVLTELFVIGVLFFSGCEFRSDSLPKAIPSALPLPEKETPVPNNLIDDSPRPAVVSPLPPTWTVEPSLLPTPIASFTPRSTSTDEPRSYIVQPGDTLGEIAIVFGVEIEELMGLNNIEDADHIEVGQELIIP